MKNKFREKIIYKYIGLGVLAVIVILFCFYGELYLSENGYLLFRTSPKFDSELQDRYGYDSCYDVVVNGVQMYIIAYSEEESKSPLTYRVTFLPERFGIIEAAVGRTDGKVSYELLDPFYLECYAAQLDDVYKMLDMTMDFLEKHWTEDGTIAIHYESIKARRLIKAAIAIAAILIWQAASFLFKNSSKLGKSMV